MKHQSLLDPGITVWVTRHVESVQNFLGKVATSHLPEDRILPTRTGLEQGRMARDFLAKKFREKGIEKVTVLSSPIKRARITARLIAEGRGPIDDRIHILAALGETSLAPRDPLNPGFRLPRGQGWLGRPLAGLDRTQLGLLNRLRSVPAEINRLAGETGVRHFVIVTHTTTGRLLMGTQFAQLDIDDLDGFKELGNTEIIRYDRRTLKAVYPKPMLVWPMPAEFGSAFIRRPDPPSSAPAFSLRN